MKACWKAENCRRRAHRAEMNSPTNYPAVRHTRMLANNLMTKDGRKALISFIEHEPEYLASSMFVTLELFYKAQAELAKLKAD